MRGLFKISMNRFFCILYFVRIHRQKDEIGTRGCYRHAIIMNFWKNRRTEQFLKKKKKEQYNATVVLLRMNEYR